MSIILKEMRLIGRFLWAFRAGAWLILDGLATVVSCVIGIWFPTSLFPVEHPRAMWLGISFFSFVIGSYLVWRQEHTKVKVVRPVASAFYDSLTVRCDTVVREWRKLADDYQNAPRESFPPATLQDPMSPVWVSAQWYVYPYRVGKLQEATNTLRSDLRRVPVQIAEWNYAHITLVEVLDELEKYKLVIAQLSVS